MPLVVNDVELEKSSEEESSRDYKHRRYLTWIIWIHDLWKIIKEFDQFPFMYYLFCMPLWHQLSIIIKTSYQWPSRVSEWHWSIPVFAVLSLLTMFNVPYIQLARIRMRLSFSSISQPRVHQLKLSLWPSSRGGPEDFKTPPTCKVWIILSQVMAI